MPETGRLRAICSNRPFGEHGASAGAIELAVTHIFCYYCPTLTNVDEVSEASISRKNLTGARKSASSHRRYSDTWRRRAVGMYRSVEKLIVPSIDAKTSSIAITSPKRKNQRACGVMKAGNLACRFGCGIGDEIAASSCELCWYSQQQQQ